MKQLVSPVYPLSQLYSRILSQKRDIPGSWSDRQKARQPVTARARETRELTRSLVAKIEVLMDLNCTCEGRS